MHLLDRKENRDVFPDRPIKKKKESDFSFGYVKRPCPKKKEKSHFKGERAKSNEKEWAGHAGGENGPTEFRKGSFL